MLRLLELKGAVVTIDAMTKAGAKRSLLVFMIDSSYLLKLCRLYNDKFELSSYAGTVPKLRPLTIICMSYVR